MKCNILKDFRSLDVYMKLGGEWVWFVRYPSGGISPQSKHVCAQEKRVHVLKTWCAWRGVPFKLSHQSLVCVRRE